MHKASATISDTIDSIICTLHLLSLIVPSLLAQTIFSVELNTANSSRRWYYIDPCVSFVPAVDSSDQNHLQFHLHLRLMMRLVVGRYHYHYYHHHHHHQIQTSLKIHQCRHHRLTALLVNNEGGQNSWRDKDESWIKLFCRICITSL